MSDPLSDMVSRHFGANNGISRAVINVQDVGQNIQGLKQLMSSDSWRSAAMLAEKLFNESIDSYPIEEVMQILLCRIISLIKLRQYSIAYQELKALGNLDRPEMFYEHYPNVFKGKKGSIVPFSIRVIAAELPRHFPNLPTSGASKEALVNNSTNQALEGISQLLVAVKGVLKWISKDESLKGKLKKINCNKNLERSRKETFFDDC